jgi:hypothetical protein
MGEFNRTLGTAGDNFFPFTLGGQSYRMSGITQGVKGQYETWLEDQQLSSAESRVKPRLSEEAYAALLEGINERIATRQYAWGGRAWAKSLRSVDGVCQLLWLCLKGQHPEVTDATVRGWFETHPAELKAAVDRVTDQIKASGQADPNGQAPGTASPGQSSPSPTSAGS